MNISLLKSELFKLFDWPIESIDIQFITGGSINQAYYCKGSDRKIFIKVNDLNPGVQMFSSESNGLEALRSSNSFRIPDVITHGSFDQYAYLILEWIEPGNAGNDFDEQFARQLAQMHSCTNDLFGLTEDNFIGSLRQSNNQHETWSDFFANERVLPITISLFNSGSIDKKTLDQTEKCLKNLGFIIPVEQPSFVHGDLWAGNYLIDKEGDPVLIDPAVYFGHREMDLAMMRLFGGFSKRIFNYYNEIFPLASGWESRVDLFQLYPLLVHAQLFGGSYVQQSLRIIQKYS